MPTMFNPALYVRKWGGKRVKRIRRNFKRNRSLNSNKSGDRQKLTWLRSYEEYGEEKSLNIALRMREKARDPDTGAPLQFNTAGGGLGTIFYKDDEDRFTQQCTLKLKTYSLYELAVEVEQSQTLMYVVVGGKKYNCFKLYDNPDNATKVYIFSWCTDKMQTTTRKHRSILPVEMKFREYEELKFSLLVKFYYNDDVLHYSGVPLTLIDIQSKVGVGNLHQTVLSTLSFE